MPMTDWEQRVAMRDVLFRIAHTPYKDKDEAYALIKIFQTDAERVLQATQ